MTSDQKFSRDRRLALQSGFLVVNAFVWYFLAIKVIESIISANKNGQEQLLLWGIYFGTLIVSCIGGSFLVNKIGRNRLFVFWTLLGVLSPVALLTLDVAQTPVIMLICIFFGLSTGLGMPNSMEYFKRSTNDANRGRYGGLMMLLSGLGIFVLGLVTGGIAISAFILILWRLLGLLLLFISKPFKENIEKDIIVSFRTILSKKSFILYLVPWLMFSLINYFTNPSKNIDDQSTIVVLRIFGNVVLAISAIAAGFLMDYVGRKLAAIAGFVLLGISYSVLGVYSGELFSWYLYTVLFGVSWGIFYVLFLFSIWGDLSQHVPSDKFYTIGVLPFFVSQFMGYVFSFLPDKTLPGAGALFSFMAFFLFIAVLPLVYAPETLPEKVMKDRDLQSYIDNAKKKAQKESEKTQKKEKPQDQNLGEKQEAKDNKEYEEAAKLAEKYY